VGRIGKAAAAANSMLRLLKRWLGWDSNSGPFDFSELRFTARQNASPPKPQPQQRTPAMARSEAPARPAASPQPSPQPQAKTAAAKKPKKNPGPMDLLDNPQLTLDRPTDDGFDPYNTGAFNRSQSWERIGRNKKN
jgi:hypothetical protein